jgi:hypothetical protein
VLAIIGVVALVAAWLRLPETLRPSIANRWCCPRS